MLILVGDTDKLQFVLNDASVSPLPAICMYRDVSTTDYVPNRAIANSNGATEVSILTGDATQKRVIDYVSIYNPNVANETVTVKIEAAGTDYVLVKVTLAQDERLEYQDGLGWSVYANSGGQKHSLNQGTNAVASGDSLVVLGADVVNSNATANTLQNITGLQFPMVAGLRYAFEFTIRYFAAASGTGSRFTINGPAFDELCYDSDNSLTVASRTFNTGMGGYQQPATSNASSAGTTANLAKIEGIIRPTVDGDLIAQFASEVAASAITAKAGSHVRYRAM
jgi:hypothetical protein